MNMPHIPIQDRPATAGDSLAFYNGPLLAWLPTMMMPHLRGNRLLALSVADDSVDAALLDQGQEAWAFLVATMTEASARAMLADRLTVRQAVLSATEWHLIPRYDAPHLKWVPVTRDQILAKGDAWLPGDVMLQVS